MLGRELPARGNRVCGSEARPVSLARVRLTMFWDLMRAQFGDGARYQYRLHPPVFRALGLRHKISLGPWFRPAFATLVAMRRPMVVPPAAPRKR